MCRMAFIHLNNLYNLPSHTIDFGWCMKDESQKQNVPDIAVNNSYNNNI